MGEWKWVVVEMGDGGNGQWWKWVMVEIGDGGVASVKMGEWK